MFATRESVTPPPEEPAGAAEGAGDVAPPPLRSVPAAEAAEIAGAGRVVELDADTPRRRWMPTLGWLQSLFDVLAEPRPRDERHERSTSYPF